MTLPHRHPPRGAILLSLVLILGVVGTAALFLLAQSNLSGVTDTNDQTKAAKVRAVVIGASTRRSFSSRRTRATRRRRS